MGRTSDEEGESSTRTCELDGSDERPLKKARYIWQIKGKYHLKKPEEEDKDKTKHTLPANNVVDSNDGYATLVEVECPKTHLGENETKSLTSPLILENVNAEQDTEVPTPGTTHEEVQQLAEAFSNWELRKWQDRQIARSFVDNTINRVLEVMGFVPLPFDADDISDEEFSFPNNENDDDVEDEAVLMAIHSHGLQRSEQEGRLPHLQQCCDENKMSIVPCICSQQASGSVDSQTPYPFHQRPVLLDLVDHDQPGQTNTSLEALEPVLTNSMPNSSISKFASSAVLHNHLQNCTDGVLEEVLVKNASNISLEKPIQPSLVDMSTNVQSQLSKDDKNSSFYEHNDFLDQAVGVAIQKKGLSTLSCLEFG